MSLGEEMPVTSPDMATDDGYLSWGPNGFADAHDGVCNIAFVDGHAAYNANPNAVGLNLVSGNGSLSCK